MSAVGLTTIAFVAAFGLMVGSFLNVVIYRLPRECLYVLRRNRSHCPRCAVQLSWYDNVPVLSYVALGGRCRRCRARISIRYPAVELLTALAFVGLLWHDRRPIGIEFPFEDRLTWLVFLVHVVVVAALIALSVIDLDFRILPDAITLPGIVVAPLLAFAVPGAMPAPLWRPAGGAASSWSAHVAQGGFAPHLNALANGLGGAALGGGLLYGIGWLGSKVFRKPAMGLGDVKLFAAMGGLLGFWVPLALVVASFAGSVIGLTAQLVRRDRYVPFGPFLALGMVVTMLWGPDILGRFLG